MENYFSKSDLNPVYAESITSEIMGDELADIRVKLEVKESKNSIILEDGKVRYAVDHIRVILEGNELGDLGINSYRTDLLKGMGNKSEYIEVIFIPSGLPYTELGCSEYGFGHKILGENKYIFLTIHEDDLEVAKDIILNKLRECILGARNKYQQTLLKERQEIKNEYIKYKVSNEVIKVTLENYREEHHSCLYEEVMKKINAIKENLECITDYSEDERYVLTKGNVKEIEIDFSSAYDEFCISGNFNSGSQISEDSNEITIEVVTKEVAEYNDLDFIDKEDEGMYELGGELSSYNPLGYSGYWYRLM